MATPRLRRDGAVAAYERDLGRTVQDAVTAIRWPCAPRRSRH